MKKNFKQILYVFFLLLIGLVNISFGASCPTINGPSDIIVDDGCSGEVVTYTPPVGQDYCSSSVVFNYTGTPQSWIVPAGVEIIRIDASGGQGGVMYILSSLPLEK